MFPGARFSCICASPILIVAAAANSAAQTMEPAANAVLQVARLNQIVDVLSKEKLLTSDAVFLSDQACVSLWALEQDANHVSGTYSRWLEEVGPEPKLEGFAAAEKDAFARFGASAETLNFLGDAIAKSPPDTTPASAGQDNGRARTICGRVPAYSLAAYTHETAQTPAEPQDIEFAKAFGWLALGATAMVVNTAITIGTGSVPLALLGVVSTGWGYGQVDENFNFLKDKWVPGGDRG